VRKIVVVVLGLMLAVTTLFADEQERVLESGRVLQELVGIPEGIPQNLLDKAECVVIMPSVKKFAIGFGGSYGRGVMTCRTGQNFTGPWSQPVMMALEGGSWGLQLGGTATDFVMLLMSPRSADAVLSSKVKLGANASAAAGPKGRDAEAATDATMRAEILTYSRARGLFAGISLAGSTLRPDGGANENLYGHRIQPRRIILKAGPGPVKAADLLVSTLNKHSPKNTSDPESLKGEPQRK